jgi:hypothetical protein
MYSEPEIVTMNARVIDIADLPKKSVQLATQMAYNASLNNTPPPM